MDVDWIGKGKGKGKGKCGKSKDKQNHARDKQTSARDKTQDICRFCGKKGHWERDCFQKQGKGKKK
eukprot:1211372-Amphidinium_carterae.1